MFHRHAQTVQSGRHIHNDFRRANPIVSKGEKKKNMKIGGFSTEVYYLL